MKEIKLSSAFRLTSSTSLPPRPIWSWWWRRRWWRWWWWRGSSRRVVGEWRPRASNYLQSETQLEQGQAALETPQRRPGHRRWLLATEETIAMPRLPDKIESKQKYLRTLSVLSYWMRASPFLNLKLILLGIPGCYWVYTSSYLNHLITCYFIFRYLLVCAGVHWAFIGFILFLYFRV